jgi:hypothetical protein
MSDVKSDEEEAHPIGAKPARRTKSVSHFVCFSNTQISFRRPRATAPPVPPPQFGGSSSEPTAGYTSTLIPIDPGPQTTTKPSNV